MKRGLKLSLILLAILLISIFIIRTISPRQIDDVTPSIFCEKKYLEKADVLWIIPNYNNTPISQNQTWCKEILSLNKTLELHGIRHYYREFEENLTQEYLNEGMQEFEECFGYPPTMFKPPKLYLSKENKLLLEKNNLKVKRYFNQITHKVYHCSDTGTLPNWFHDLF